MRKQKRRIKEREMGKQRVMLMQNGKWQSKDLTETEKETKVELC